MKNELTFSRIEHSLDRPMVFLAFLWLVLTIIDLTTGLSDFLQAVNYLIWFLFILDFLLEFLLAPKKVMYLKRNLLFWNRENGYILSRYPKN